MNDDGAADSGQEFRKVERAIVERDDFTCQFCSFRDPLGFRAPRYLGVHHHDDDHANNAPGNLITACHPCHMVHHLGFAGMSGDYALAWLPELPQVKLFHLVRSITVATHFAAALEQGQVAQTVRATVRAMEEAAQNLMAALHSRQTAAKKIYGTADPAEMANALLLLDDDAYAARRRTIGALRLLPLGTLTRDGANVMPRVVDRWLSPQGPYSNLKPTSWLSLLANANQRLGQRLGKGA